MMSTATRTSEMPAERATYRVLVQEGSFIRNLVYGGTAGLIGAMCTFPVDTAKTRLQAASGPTPQYKYARIARGSYRCLSDPRLL